MALLRLAKSGGSVEDAEKDLSFTSRRDCLIELISDTITVSSTGNYQHSLGYSPAYTAFMKVINPNITGVPAMSWSPCVGFIGNVVNGGVVTIDTDKIYFETYTEYDPIGEVYNYVPTDFYYSIFSNSISNTTGTGKTNVTGKFKVAKSGLSVPEITDARQFQFFNGNVLKQSLPLSQSIDITFIDYDLTVVPVDHNLGYVPIVYAFENDNGSRMPYATPTGNIFTYFVDNMKIYFVGGNMGDVGGDTYTIKYIVTMDKIA